MDILSIETSEGIIYIDSEPGLHMFIGIAGLIGVGKTTLTKQLADQLNCQVAYEPVETNPYLEDFYADKERHGAMMQLHLLGERFKQHQSIIWSQTPTIQDRTIYEDTIFAKMGCEDGWIGEREYRTYKQLFHMMTRFLAYPDLLVYLRVEPEVALERIEKRGRGAEEGMPIEYLRSLHEGYESFIEDINRFVNVLRIDWSEFRPVEEVASAVLDITSKPNMFNRSMVRI